MPAAAEVKLHPKSSWRSFALFQRRHPFPPASCSSEQHTITLELLLRAWHRLLQTPAHKQPIWDIYRHAGAPYVLRILRVLQSFLTQLVTSRSSPTEQAYLVCAVLQYFYEQNQVLPLVSVDVFYNQAVGATDEQLQELQRWLLQPSAVFSFAQYPFLLLPTVKGQLLTALNANSMMTQMTRNVMFGA